MPNPSAESLKGRIARLEGELDEVRGRNDDLTQQVVDARKLAERAVKAGEERAEEDAGRINTLKAICGEKDGEIAELRGYIRRVHELDDAASPLAPVRPPSEQARTRLAREDNIARSSRGSLPDGWTSVAERFERPRHWSSI